MPTAIKIENLSKAYQLGQIGTGTLSRDLERWWAGVRQKEDPFLKIGEENNQATISQTNIVWSLKDISFEIQQGDTVGIIGRNGAGKSTLLKILSRVTAPTKGSIKAKGRIASLLEVGTGFHPELSGRENIYLNGAILGMRKKEIDRKLAEIIDFSGVEKYIDTPVKRYSSGMYVRLAFAVAAHLDSEILIVDEVLAVGDAEFQKKCLGKMKAVSNNEGRTVLFVSHNMAAVKSLCSSGILLKNGIIQLIGNATDIVSAYLKGDSESENRKMFDGGYNNEDFNLKEISFNPKGETFNAILDEYQEIEINIKIDIKQMAERRKITFVLNNEEGEPIFTFSHSSSGISLKNGFNHLICFLPKGFLNVGTYYLSFYLIQDSKESIFIEKDIISFGIQVGERGIGSWMGNEPGFIKPIFNWQSIN